MLLRTKLSYTLLCCAAATTVVSCDSSDDVCAQNQFSAPGILIYSFEHHEPPGPDKLYKNKDRIHFARFSNDTNSNVPGTHMQAVLTPEALELIDAASTHLGSNGSLGSYDAGCLSWVDRPTARLYLPAGGPHSQVEFGYPWACAPSALTELDDMLRTLIFSLPECEPSEFYTDCAPVD